MSENHLCYFCDTQYPHPSSFIENYNGIWVCQHCEMLIPINNTQENDCCVCFEYKPLIKLPTCIHKVCLDCCKTIKKIWQPDFQLDLDSARYDK